MNAGSDGAPHPMRPATGLLLIAVVAILAAGTLRPPGPSPFAVSASAPTATIEIASDHAVAGREDGLNLTVWLNVTGNGQFQRTWVNVSFNTQAVPSENSLIQWPATWTQPSGCTYDIASGWFLEWHCDGLRAGTYVWGIPAYVPSNATVGHYQRVDASTYSTIGTGNVTGSANTTVWIAGAVLRIVDIDSEPTDSVRAGQIVNYWINATNDATEDSSLEGVGTAHNVTVAVGLDPGLHPGEGLANLTMRFPSLAPAYVLSINFEAIVAENLTPGASVAIRVEISYQDFNYHTIGPLAAESRPLYVVQPNLLSTPNLLAGAAIGLAAIFTTLVVVLYVGQRKIVIDEAFLMTKGGLLIRHVSRQAELGKDDDLVASMFVAIQEFVRDSFRREASLDSVAFGTRRAAVVRGELTILAAVISHGDADAVTPELLAAVRSIEAQYWDALLNWDGSLSKLEGVDESLAALMKGKFRSAWRVQLA